MIVLGLIQLFGGLYAALILDLIPLPFIMGFVLPHLTWQIPSILFIVLITWQFQRRSNKRASGHPIRMPMGSTVTDA